MNISLNKLDDQCIPLIEELMAKTTPNFIVSAYNTGINREIAKQTCSKYPDRLSL